MVAIRIVNEDKVYKGKRNISLNVSLVLSWITKDHEKQTLYIIGG